MSGSDTARSDRTPGAALIAGLLVLAGPIIPTPTWARVSQSEITACADSPKAEAAIAACTRLYEDGGLDARNKAVALGNRAAAYKLMGKYDEALADVDIAVGLDPRNPQYWCQRGDLRGKKQMFAEAISDYTTALEKAPNYAWAFRGRGYAHLSRGDAKLALADFNEALRAKPDDFNLTFMRGRANSQAQNWDAAIVDFTSALNTKGAANLLPSERATILSQRAFARLKLGRTADAKADVDEALRMAPKSAFSLAVSGLVEEEQGHKTEAASLYNRALALDSGIEFARHGLDRVQQTEAAFSPPPATPDTTMPPPTTTSPPPTSKAEATPKPAPKPIAETGKGPVEELCARYVPTVGTTVLVACAK